MGVLAVGEYGRGFATGRNSIIYHMWGIGMSAYAYADYSVKWVSDGRGQLFGNFLIDNAEEVEYSLLLRNLPLYMVTG